MKIKTKLTLGVGLLFTLIVLLSLVAAKYINELKNDTENILVANYHTLEYGRNMLIAMEPGVNQDWEMFERNLQKQEKNTTEITEKETTTKLRIDFNKYLNNPSDSSSSGTMRMDIFELMDMNMLAIQRKSKIAKTTANSAVFWIVITGSMCFIIAFILLIKLPSNIANPIKVLSKSIQQIANKNYSERVDFESHSEFGQLATSFNTMAEKLEEYNNSNLAKLMMEKQRIDTLINNMHDPVIGLDENLNVIFANEEAIKITGTTHESIIGNQIKDLAISNDLIRTLAQDLNTTSSEVKPLKIFTDNKEGYFEKEIVRITIKPTGEQSQKLIGHVIILRNITAYKELDFAKTNFIATVSHEFKTPISSIKLSLQLLENEKIGKLNTEQQNLLESIKEDAGRLLKITGELLNITQVESGNIQLSLVSTEPKEILNYAINATQTQADEKQIKFEFNCPETISNVHADKEKTAWILTNLISNAVRYSYDNSTIFLKMKEEGDKVQISVRDTGQGIDPKYIDKVFDRYFRVPGTKKEGTGLGLAISKEFVEAQNGHIKVDSDFGAGSTFTLTLNKSV